jgi:DNA-binding response OmpR family regulator
MSPPDDRKAILIIDDDDDFAAALSVVLANAGYRVRRAADGDEGVRMAAEEPPDLVLLDLMMPRKNGFDTSGDLRGVPALRDVPILAITAFGQDLGELYSRGPGTAAVTIHECLEKPVEPNVLLERVASCLVATPPHGRQTRL